MTGKSHIASTFVTSISTSVLLHQYNSSQFTLQLCSLFIISSLLSARLPDQIEKLTLNIFKHRTVSHSILIIGLLIYSSYTFLLLTHNESINYNIYLSIYSGLCFGYVLHLLMDSFSYSGIPLLITKPKFRIPLYKTNKLSEAIFLASFCSVYLLILTNFF